MRSRYWFTISCLPMAIAFVAVGLMVWTTPTREQRAIANLVKSGAHVVLFDGPNGTRCLDVDLHGCKDNDEPLNYVPDIENVQGLHLGVVPVHEVGVKCLLRLKGLRYLNVDDTGFSPGVFTQLERDLKRNNPHLEIGERRVIELK